MNQVDNHNTIEQIYPRHFDVLVLGGGVAGASAGLCLLNRGNVSVGLIDSGNHSEERAGESISPSVKPLLNFLGLWDQFVQTNSLEELSCKAAWGSNQLRSFDTSTALKNKRWCIDRNQFDVMLTDSFAARGGNLFSNTKVITCKKHVSKGWLVTAKNASGEVNQFTCQYLIDASGRRGLLRTNLNLSLSVYDRLVGVGCVGNIPTGKTLAKGVQIEACEYGWWHISPLPNHKISVVLMSDPDIISHIKVSQTDVWTKLMKKMPITGRMMEGITFKDKPRSFPCFSSYLKKMGGDNWIAVGDAVASYDPLCSSGILRAIDSGIHGALVAIDTLFSDGRQQLLQAYSQAIQKEFSNYLQTQWQYYQRETRWTKSLFWVRRRSVIGVSSDAIIRETYFYEHQLDHMPVHLQGHELQDLWGLCKPSKKLKQVVRDFSLLYPHVAEQKIMLALQELIQKESIKLAVQELDYNSDMHPYSMMEKTRFYM